MLENLFSDVKNFVTAHSSISTLFIILLPLSLQYWRYLKEWNFNNYHKLIKDLVQSDTSTESIKLDRQMAVVYELRKYPRYFSVSKRILQGWLDRKSENETKEFSLLYSEMRLTLEFINKCFISRWLDNIFKK
jgi:hypothetical protein